MPESQNIEWKSKWKDEYPEWICGYANAQGGKIYIGCDDDGNVIGLPNARKLLEDVPNKIRDAMGIIVGVNLYEENGKEYIEIDADLLYQDEVHRKHASSPYNPNIAHVFYLAGFIESWGRGIEKICSACEKDGVPQPIYTINPGDIMIAFTAPEDRVIRSVTRKVTDRVTEKVTDNLDEKSIQILTLISEDPAYTSTAISEKLSISRKTISQKLKEMKENGIIERIGSDRKGYWKINNE